MGSACPPAPHRSRATGPTASTLQAFLSQNHIEEHLLTLLAHHLSPGVRRAVVADRGFARAQLFRWLRGHDWLFVIRIDATTHVSLTPDGPSAPAAEALRVRRGEQRWQPGGTYQQEERVPVNLLAVWDADQDEPWYLATNLATAQQTETLYRWRMRIECGNRDTKTGVLLREGGDDHALQNVLHLHRLLLLLCAADWLCGLTGLQALHDLPDPAPPVDPALDQALPPCAEDHPLLAQGPCLPPPVIPPADLVLRFPPGSVPLRLEDH